MASGSITSWQTEGETVKTVTECILGAPKSLQNMTTDMKQRTGSKLGKEYDKAVYCHPVYLTSMQNTSCEIPG